MVLKGSSGFRPVLIIRKNYGVMREMNYSCLFRQPEMLSVHDAG